VNRFAGVHRGRRDATYHRRNQEGRFHAVQCL
jgi:hypothetical protein